MRRTIPFLGAVAIGVGVGTAAALPAVLLTPDRNALAALVVLAGAVLAPLAVLAVDRLLRRRTDPVDAFAEFRDALERSAPPGTLIVHPDDLARVQAAIRSRPSSVGYPRDGRLQPIDGMAIVASDRVKRGSVYVLGPRALADEGLRAMPLDLGMPPA